MKRNDFLNKLKNEGRLELVEPNGEVCESFLQKSDNCIASARLLLDNGLFENSVGMSYYAMYDSLTALLFRTGIKCENHSGSILLLRLLFSEQELFRLISDAKEERIDRQYYVTTEKDESTRQSAQELLLNAESFSVKMRLAIKNLNNDDIDAVREKFGILAD